MTRQTKTASSAQTSEAAGSPSKPAKSSSATKAPTKLATLVALLKTPQGATIAALAKATGWQAHSVRGAMSGTLKKAMGLTIVSEKVEGERIYRISEGSAE